VITDNTGKFDALSTGYADRYLSSLARTLEGVAVIESYDWVIEDGIDVLTWHGYVESPSSIETLRFSVLNDPADEVFDASY